MGVTINDLESFVLETQPQFEQIKRSLAEFNIFNVLGVQRREIRHSNFIGWLFDPNESHKLGDVFLKDLFKLMRNVKAIDSFEFVALLLKDLSETQVYRESIHNIDILIVNETLSFVICIENKINTKYSDHQLEKYFNYVEENYNEIADRIYLTLTPFKDENHLNFRAGDNYTNISYQDIIRILKTNKSIIDKSIPTVRESINQYIAMTEKNIIYSSDEVKLAQKIYKKYKNEIEFIINNKPNFISSRSLILECLRSGEFGDFEIIENDFHAEITRILPKNDALKAIFKDPEFQSWNGDYMFCLEFFVQKNHIWLKWCFGDIRNENKKASCQAKKTRMVNIMLDFDCFRSSGLGIDFHNANPELDYTGICGVSLFNYDTYLNQDKELIEFLKDRFKIVHDKLIDPWIEECLLKLQNI